MDRASPAIESTSSFVQEMPAARDGLVAAPARQLAHLAAVLGALAAFVDEVAVGVLVLDAAGRALHANRRATAIVARGDTLRIDAGGRMALPRPEAQARLAALIRAGGVMRLPRRGGLPACTLLIAPQAAGALVLIHDPDGTVAPPRAMLETVFGLTVREAELAAALVAGARLGEFAARSGITRNTVKWHLRSIFLKTGTRTQVALVRKVAMALAGLGGEGLVPLWGRLALANPAGGLKHRRQR